MRNLFTKLMSAFLMLEICREARVKEDRGWYKTWGEAKLKKAGDATFPGKSCGSRGGLQFKPILWLRFSSNAICILFVVKLETLLLTYYSVAVCYANNGNPLIREKGNRKRCTVLVVLVNMNSRCALECFTLHAKQQPEWGLYFPALDLRDYLF